MDDNQFKDFMDRLAAEKQRLAIFVPNSKATAVSIENNLEIAKQLNHKFFSKLYIKGKPDVPDHMTAMEYLVMDLPYRRASQLVSKKIKIPKDNKTIDSLSGQATGASKGAKISYSELLLLSSMGLEDTIKELITIRGGDNKALVAYNGIIDKYGKVTLKSLEDYRSVVKSSSTLKTLLAAMHLSSNL